MKSLFIICLLFFQSVERQGERDKMVREQIETRGVNDQKVLQAMRSVLRHKLVPREYAKAAYQDRPLPIGQGQTISQPFIVAYMTSVIQPKADMKVLEIGTGSGYQAAVLAEIVDQVYTLEIVPELGEQAKEDLTTLGYQNIHVRVADGYNGWEENGPFDAIVVTAASEHIPPSLIQQLKEGGKMIIPIDSGGKAHELVLVEKSNGKTKTKNVMPVRFVPFMRANEN